MLIGLKNVKPLWDQIINFKAMEFDEVYKSNYNCINTSSIVIGKTTLLYYEGKNF